MDNTANQTITPEQEQFIRQNVYVVNCTVFFTRLKEPTEATIDYSGAYLLGIIERHKITSLAIDVRFGEVLEYKLRKRMFMQLLHFQEYLSHVYIIRPADPLFMVAANFGFRVLNLHKEMSWSIHDGPEDVLALIQSEQESAPNT